MPKWLMRIGPSMKFWPEHSEEMALNPTSLAARLNELFIVYALIISVGPKPSHGSMSW